MCTEVMWKTNNYFDTSIDILELVGSVLVTQRTPLYMYIYTLIFSIIDYMAHRDNIAQHSKVCNEIDIIVENGFSNVVLTAHSNEMG